MSWRKSISYNENMAEIKNSYANFWIVIINILKNYSC